MERSRFFIYKGLKVLKRVADTTGESLEVLCLVGFFDDDITFDRMEPAINEMKVTVSSF